MCIGIPMEVIEILNDSAAICRGKDETGALNTMMVGPLEVGSWVLAWNGMAVSVITEERARQVQIALDALKTAADGGTPDVEDAFSDIVSQTGSLPPHLAKLVKNA